ncbi:MULTISPECIES: hypothetical protein [Bacillus]|nr:MULTISPECIES: hypothetical protein [Bacillus]MCX2853768.1 hypothetical protein [Bacillus sp. KeR2]MDH3078508.1 hypothetical protein [Bacillus amyloliquefaciens]MDH3103697.1 hypothetical protein [Bacillus velezensis]
MLIKTELLKQGKSFKNHRSFCEEMGLQFKNSTNSKKAQLKELERYCTYSKSGHSIVIGQVFDKPLPKEGNAKNTVYNEIIQWLVLDILAQEHNDGNVTITKSKLISSFGLVNRNYFKHMRDKQGISLLAETGIETVNDFYKTSQSNFKKAIETALKGLVDRSMIMYETVFKVKENGESVSRKATLEEKELILYWQKQVMTEMGYNSLSQLRGSGAKSWNTFENRVKKEVYKRSRVNDYFQAYNITVNRRHLERECISMLDFLLKKAKREDFISQINNKVCIKLLTNAKKRHMKSSVERVSKPHRSQKNYIDDINSLIDILIKKDAPTIDMELQKVERTTLHKDTIDQIELLNFGM